MITDRQREIVRKVWVGDDFPSDEKIELAYERWKAELETHFAEAKTINDLSDFYFDFSFTLTSYSPLCWMHLFSDKQ